VLVLASATRAAVEDHSGRVGVGVDIVVTIFWVAVAAVFYRVRCWSRLLCGAMEVAAGIGVIIIGEFPPNAIASASSWTLGSRAAHVLALMGGVYIVVRGLQYRSSAAETVAPGVAPRFRRRPRRPLLVRG
jgi:hypothetical protein